MTTDYSPLVSEFETAAQEASYNAWLNAKVQASFNDPRPSVPHDQVMAKARTLLNELKAVHA
jgi:hypothetical protein